MTIIPTTVHIFPVSIQYVVSNVFAVIRSLQRNLCGCRGQWKIQTAVENSQARRGRCRFRDTSTWKCHVRKRLRNSGKSYNSRDGKVRREKLLKPGCGAKCRLRCHDRIPVEQREEIFQSYWKIGNLHAQRQFLVTQLHEIPGVVLLNHLITGNDNSSMLFTLMDWCCQYVRPFPCIHCLLVSKW